MQFVVIVKLADNIKQLIKCHFVVELTVVQSLLIDLL